MSLHEGDFIYYQDCVNINELLKLTDMFFPVLWHDDSIPYGKSRLDLPLVQYGLLETSAK